MRLFRATSTLLLIGLLANYLPAQVGAQTPAAYGKKIYLLSSISPSGNDVNDEDIILAYQRNQEMIIGAFEAHVPSTSLVVFGADGSSWPDSSGVANSQYGFNREDLKLAIESCPAGPNDTIVVYWNGHGGGGFQPLQHLLHMRDNEPLDRDELLSWIKAKGARLSVLITDTCAQSVRLPLPAGARMAEPRREIAPLFDALFFQPRGSVNINSARPGEYAMRVPPVGSLFTLALAGTPGDDNDPIAQHYGYLYRNADSSSKSWSTVIAELQVDLSAIFKLSFPNGWEGQMDQHIWVLELPETGPGSNICCHRCRCCHRLWCRRLWCRRHFRCHHQCRLLSLLRARAR